MAPRPPGVHNAARPQRCPTAALPPADHLPLQPVTRCELTNEHIVNKYTNKQTTQPTNKHDGLQHLLRR